MKKFKVLFVLVIMAAFSSCEDSYNIVQDGEFNESATFKSVKDMQLYLNEVYDNGSSLDEIGFTAIVTDEVGFGSQNAGQDRDLYGFILNSNEQRADDIWIDEYTLINRCNRLLRGAALVTPNPSAGDEVAQYNSIVAQARALRAYGHMQLLTYFSTDLKDDNALGVIAIDRVPGIFEKLPRNTNGEVFALIESDLQFAYDNVVDKVAGAPNTDPLLYAATGKPWTYISKNYINAFRARMYAYRGNYTLAKQYADAAINTAAASSITLNSAAALPYSAANFYNATTTTNPYRRMWQDLAQGEIIFSFDKSVGKEAIAGQFYFNRTNLTGGPFHDMNRNLFNLLDSDVDNANATGVAGDIRLNAFIDPTSKIDQATPLVGVAGTAPYYETDANYQANDVPLIDKYPGKAGLDLINDQKIFRLSEMYFIKAEALVSEGDLTGAAAIIKSIRDVRNRVNPNQPLPVYANATAAWADILKERRIELCYEGHRYIDLKRLGALAGVTIDRYTRDCETVVTCSIPVTDHRFTVPVPINEINTNTNMVQNPEY